jgi:hypothetical protein
LGGIIVGITILGVQHIVLEVKYYTFPLDIV